MMFVYLYHIVDTCNENMAEVVIMMLVLVVNAYSVFVYLRLNCVYFLLYVYIFEALVY